MADQERPDPDTRPEGEHGGDTNEKADDKAIVVEPVDADAPGDGA